MERSAKLFLARIPTPRGVTEQEVSVGGERYWILRQLGSGGFSTVYSVLGTDGKTYALKHLQAGSGSSARAQMVGFKEEIEKIKQLQGNESIIRHIGSEIAGNVARIVLEEGDKDLKAWIAEQRTAAGRGAFIAEEAVRRVWRQILDGVRTIHTFCPRIVHGDLKPANFLFVRGRVKLIDFGTCMKVPDDTINVAHGGSLLGTLNYMAPEAIEACHTEDAKYGIPRDIWSLGCILYAMVYGYPPFASFRGQLPKMQKIIDPSFEIPYPTLPLSFTRSRGGAESVPDVVDVMQSCLLRKPRLRPHVVGSGGRDGLLEHEFLVRAELRLSDAAIAAAAKDPLVCAAPEPAAAAGHVAAPSQSEAPRSVTSSTGGSGGGGGGGRAATRARVPLQPLPAVVAPRQLPLRPPQPRRKPRRAAYGAGVGQPLASVLSEEEESDDDVDMDTSADSEPEHAAPAAALAPAATQARNRELGSKWRRKAAAAAEAAAAAVEAAEAAEAEAAASTLKAANRAAAAAAATSGSAARRRRRGRGRFHSRGASRSKKSLGNTTATRVRKEKQKEIDDGEDDSVRLSSSLSRSSVPIPTSVLDVAAPRSSSFVSVRKPLGFAHNIG